LFLTGNTMMQSVNERIPELAVLKTLGFSDGKVVALVLVEALLLCVAAAFAGLALASMIFPAMKAIFGSLTMPLVVILTGVGMAVALALLSGLPPAWRAKQLNIVDALAGR
jgi:putative ABC transport system permease protein